MSEFENKFKVNNNTESRIPPVTVGDRYNIKIVGMGKTGDGVAKIYSYVIFVKANNLNIGEMLEIVIIKTTPRFGFAKRVEDVEYTDFDDYAFGEKL